METMTPSSTGILLEFVIGYVHSRCTIGFSLLSIARISSRYFTSSSSSSKLRVSASSRLTVASNDFREEEERQKDNPWIREWNDYVISECVGRWESPRRLRNYTFSAFVFANLMNPLKWRMEFWRDSVCDRGVFGQDLWILGLQVENEMLYSGVNVITWRRHVPQNWTSCVLESCGKRGKKVKGF